MGWDGDGRWGVLVDGTLIGLNFGSGQLALGPGPLTAELGMDFTYGLVNAGVTYTAHEWMSHGFNSELDIIGGVRYTYYDLDLRGRIGPAPVTLSDTLHWVDAIIGARVRGENTNGVTYMAYVDIRRRCWLLGSGCGDHRQDLEIPDLGFERFWRLPGALPGLVGRQ